MSNSSEIKDLAKYLYADRLGINGYTDDNDRAHHATQAIADAKVLIEAFDADPELFDDGLCESERRLAG